MLYVPLRPATPGDPIRLYPGVDSARVDALDGTPIVAVAARFDAPSRRLVPLWPYAQECDLAWTSPAERHADGTIVARGPIPELLFVD
jgi:hypothetical protein